MHGKIESHLAEAVVTASTLLASGPGRAFAILARLQPPTQDSRLIDSGLPFGFGQQPIALM